MKLKGRSAIVTGASLGVGFAIAEALIACGVRVAGIARDAGRLRSVSVRLGEAFLPVPCDVGDFDQVKTAIKTIRKALGTVDILVNNAGVGYFGAVDKFATKDWDEMFATNVSGVFHCVREVVPLMKAKRRGHIINIASIAGMVGYPNASGYNATKFAVRGLSEALYKELGEFGIKVSAVSPGSTDTAFGGGVDSKALRMRPEEVAGTVVHILEAPDGLLISEAILRPFWRKA